MAKSKYNHVDNIESFQKIPGLKFLKPGMIIRFRYHKPNTFDNNPLVLFLWLEHHKVIHGLNLNYLNFHEFKQLFKVLNLDFTVGEVQDDKRPKPFYEDFTRVVIPSMDVKKTKDRTLSHDEAKTQMKRMYETIIKPKILRGENIYRKYLRKNITGLEAINLKKIK